MIKYISGNHWAAYIIVLNSSIISWLFVLFFFGGFTPDQVITLVEIIGPLLAYFVVPAFRNVGERQNRRRSDPRYGGPAFLQSLIVPTVLYAIMAGCMFLQAQGRTFANFEEFKLLWAALQALVALYLGANRHELFPTSMQAR